GTKKIAERAWLKVKAVEEGFFDHQHFVCLQFAEPALQLRRRDCLDLLKVKSPRSEKRLWNVQLPTIASQSCRMQEHGNEIQFISPGVPREQQRWTHLGR